MRSVFSPLAERYFMFFIVFRFALYEPKAKHSNTGKYHAAAGKKARTRRTA
jgi:hypothetical protein